MDMSSVLWLLPLALGLRLHPEPADEASLAKSMISDQATKAESTAILECRNAFTYKCWKKGGHSTRGSKGGGLAALDELTLIDTHNLFNNQHDWFLKEITTVDKGLVGHAGYYIFGYKLGDSGTSYNADFALDAIQHGGLPDYESDYSAFQTTAGYAVNNLVPLVSNPTMPTFAAVTTTSDAGKFNINQGGTTSSLTGPTEAHTNTHYLFTETSGTSGLGKYMFLRTPDTVVDSTSFNFQYHAYGATFDDNAILYVFFKRTECDSPPVCR